jgi:hypothetical protein
MMMIIIMIIIKNTNDCEWDPIIIIIIIIIKNTNDLNGIP